MLQIGIFWTYQLNTCARMKQMPFYYTETFMVIFCRYTKEGKDLCKMAEKTYTLLHLLWSTCFRSRWVFCETKHRATNLSCNWQRWKQQYIPSGLWSCWEGGHSNLVLVFNTIEDCSWWRRRTIWKVHNNFRQAEGNSIICISSVSYTVALLDVQLFT